MRTALLLTFIVLASSGCRALDPNAEREIALLRSEILDLEDQYYSLRSQRDTAVMQLRDCQGASFDASQFPESQTSYPQYAGQCVNCGEGEIIYDSSPIVYEDQSFGPIVGGNAIASPGNSIAPPLNTMDQIQSFESGSPVIETDSTLEEVPAIEGSDGGNDGGDAGESTSILNRQYDVSQADNGIRAVQINSRQTQGKDLDGVPGHEGITLLVQPINRQGQVVSQNGQMTVQLIERDRLASSRQIGRWDFTPEEIQSFRVRDGLPDQGILLHLPWSAILPTQKEVSLMVNFVSSGNQRFTSRMQIPIQPPAKRYTLDDELIANWIENDSRWLNNDSNFQIEPTDMDLGSEFGDPEFNNAADAIEIEAPFLHESESERRTSVPRWRPVR